MEERLGISCMWKSADLCVLIIFICGTTKTDESRRFYSQNLHLNKELLSMWALDSGSLHFMDFKSHYRPLHSAFQDLTFLRSARNLETLFWLLLMNATAFFTVSAQMVQCCLASRPSVRVVRGKKVRVELWERAAAPAANVVASERERAGCEWRGQDTGKETNPFLQNCTGLFNTLGLNLRFSRHLLHY